MDSGWYSEGERSKISAMNMNRSDKILSVLLYILNSGKFEKTKIALFARNYV